MLHPTELARQITLLTHDFIRETGLDELNNNKSKRNRQLTNFFVNRSVFYLRGVLVLTKSLKERQALLERIMEMVVVFELHNNFLWVQIRVTAEKTKILPVHIVISGFGSEIISKSYFQPGIGTGTRVRGIENFPGQCPGPMPTSA